MSPLSFTLGLGLALAASGCGGSEASGVAPNAPPPEATSQTITLRAGETVGPVEIASGESVTVEGAARLGTGRSWRLASPPEGVVTEPLLIRSASGADGGKDVQVFALTVSASGEYRLRFVYGVPWEETPEAESVVLLRVR